MGYLEYLEIENFKSYRGKITLGPFSSKFSSIIGPNGSGKSNVMDAISFVLGERTAQLRVKKLDELIHGANVNHPVSNTARVTAVYNTTDDDGVVLSTTRFTRIIQGSSSQCQIDGKKVSNLEYSRALEAINIFIKYKNFLVFQGQVEQIALKNPLELSELFEQISGASEFKAAYNKALIEKKNADNETTKECNRKKNIANERKEAKLRMDEADKYKRICTEYKNQLLQQQLLKLFINEKTISKAESSLKDITQEHMNLQNEANVKNEKLKSMKQNLGKHSREMQATDKKINAESQKLGVTRPKYIKAKESTKHVQNKQGNNEKSLAKAQKSQEEAVKSADDLKAQLDQVVNAKEKYSNQFEEEQRKLAEAGVVFTEADAKEYKELKSKCTKKFGEVMGKIQTAEREVQGLKDVLESKNHQKIQISNDIERKQKEYDNNNENIDSMRNHIDKTKADISRKQGERDNQARQLEDAKTESKRLQAELDTISKRQGDARVEQHEQRRRKKDQETVMQLKSMYGGVYGRLIDLLTPIDRKYNIALTKIMGGHMKSVVVDTSATAQKCIKYLKEQRIDIETFLPADNLKFKPLDESLRERIRQSNGVDRKAKLVFDVIKYRVFSLQNFLNFFLNSQKILHSV